MAMRFVYDPTATIAGWWDPALTEEGWFDEGFAPDLPGGGGMTVANSGTPVVSKTPNSYTTNSKAITLATTTPGAVNFIWIVAHCSGTNVDPVATMAAAGFTLLNNPSSISDGTSPSVWGYLFGRVYQSGDGSTATVSFTPNTIATMFCWGRSGVDLTATAATVKTGTQVPSSSAKSTETLTSIGGWIESGFGDRTNTAAYSAYADTLVLADGQTSGACGMVQSSLADVTAGSQTRTATASNTAAGVDFIMELIPAAGGPSAYAGVVIGDTPAGYWRLGESSGSTAADSSGNGRDGTYSGPTLGAAGLLVGDSDKAITNGGGDNTTIPNGSWINSGTAFSVEAIIKPSSLSGTHTIASAYQSAAFSNSRFTLRFDGSTLKLYTFDSVTFYFATCSASFSTGVKHHVIATYNSGTIKFYIDGVLAGTGYVPPTNNAVTVAFVIGSLVGGAENFIGELDEVAYYGYELSAAQASIHYDVSIGLPPPAPTLIVPKVWDGSAWVDADELKIWDGSAWLPYEALTAWDGSAWQDS
jgi:hypothetical protein